MARVSPSQTSVTEKLPSDAKTSKSLIGEDPVLDDVKEFLRQNSGAPPTQLSPNGLVTSMSFSSRNGSIFKTPNGSNSLQPQKLEVICTDPSPCSVNIGTPCAAGPSQRGREAFGEEDTNNDMQKKKLRKMVDSWMFSFCISIVILANAVQMGFEVDDRDQQINWSIIELIFLAIYLLEVALRFCAHGGDSLRDRWFVLDLVICCIALFDTIRNFVDDKEDEAGNTVVMLRVLRGMKLIRLVRLFRFFPELYLLVSSLGSAMKTVMWMWVLLGLVIYTFSLLFVSEMGRQYPEDKEIQLWFGTVIQSCFTLFTIVTLEGWVDVVRHIWDESPFTVFVVIFFMTITTYMIMNILVGVVVQHVIDKALASQEQELTQMEIELEHKTKTLLAIFQAADCDGDASLSKAEFLQMAENKKLSHIFDVLELKLGDIEALFDHMDVNGDGALEVQEFVSAIMQMRGGARAKRVFELHNDVTRLSSVFAQHAVKTEQALDRMQRFEEKTDRALHKQGESIQRMEKALEALTMKICGSVVSPDPPVVEGSSKQTEEVVRLPTSVLNSQQTEEVVSQQNGTEQDHEELRKTADAQGADGLDHAGPPVS